VDVLGLMSCSLVQRISGINGLVCGGIGFDVMLFFLVPNVFVGNAYRDAPASHLIKKIELTLERRRMHSHAGAMGTREKKHFHNAERCVKAFPNGVWERGNDPSVDSPNPLY